MPGRAPAAQHQQPGGPVAVPGVGGEQLAACPRRRPSAGSAPSRRSRAGGSRRPTPRRRRRMARWRISAEVHGPIPGSDRSRRSASAGVIPAISSSRSATRAAPMIVRARTRSTPARCHAQEGMRDPGTGGGHTRIPGGAGPGAGSPYRSMSIRQARVASAPTTFCSSMAGTSASNTRPDRPIRSAGCRRSSRAATGAPAGSRSGRRPRPAARAGRRAPRRRRGPRPSVSTVEPSRAARRTAPSGAARPWTRMVAGPSGVSDVRHTAPDGSTRKAGSPLPRRCTPRVRARSTWNGGCHRLVSTPSTAGLRPGERPAVPGAGAVRGVGHHLRRTGDPRQHAVPTAGLALHVRGEAHRGRGRGRPPATPARLPEVRCPRPRSRRRR